jgi:hypothetical protein
MPKIMVELRGYKMIKELGSRFVFNPYNGSLLVMDFEKEAFNLTIESVHFQNYARPVFL